MALPPQELPANTYYDISGTKLAIERLKMDEDESPISGIWISILQKIFPPAEKYMIRPQQFLANGIPDLVVLHYLQQDGKTKEYDFLVVQCKRLSGESQNSVWNGAMSQLGDYLPDLKPKNVAHRVYGIVAVGRWAQFVEYDANAPNGLVALDNQTGKFHITRQCRTVERMLEYIKNRHG